MNDKRFTKIRARFMPHPDHIDTLRPGLKGLIGVEAEFMYAWIGEEDETFPGVWALTTTDERFGGYWVPEFDLEVL